MDAETVGNFFQCIPIADVSLHNLIVSALAVSLGDICKELMERRRPGIPLGTRNLFYFMSVSEKLPHARNKILATRENLVSRLLPVPMPWIGGPKI